MNLQVRNRIRKALTYTVTGVLFLVISAFLVLQIPAVQQYFIKRYLGKFSTVTGFNSTVGSFQLLWFDRLEMRNLTIFDPDGNKMIGAQTLVINFKLSQLFQERDINIDGVFVEGGHVLITKIPEGTDTNLNINVFVNRINEKYGGSGGTGKTPQINIGEAILNESRFSYIDQEKDSIKTGFNYNQFTVDVEESQLQNFMILGDTTEFKVNTLLAKDRDTKFEVKQLSTFFRLSQQAMEFTGLNLQAGKSVISDTIIFRYDSLSQMNEFVSQVNVHANLQNTLLLPEDLALFAPEAGKLGKPIYLTGVFDGKIDNFRFNKMEIGLGRTILRGSLDMEGLPDINETFIILGLNNSRIDFQDFSFLFKDQALSRLTPMGRVTLDGEFLGYPNDFVARGDFSGNLGRISSDINFKVNEKDFDHSVYSGKLSLIDFELGAYLKDTANFQQVTLTGNVKGSGLTVKTADFKLNGKIKEIGIRKYDYQNITTNARFASQLFSGYVQIDDPNLQLTAQGSVDLREKYNAIKMNVNLDTVLLQNLKLTPQNIALHTKLDIDVRGLHIDSLTGNADLKDFHISYNNRPLSLKEIHLSAAKSASSRKLSLRTNLINANVDGNFQLSDISKDIQTLVHEFKLNIANDQQQIAAYYEYKNYRPKTYQTNFKFELLDIDPIVKLLNTKLSISNNTDIEGKFTSGYTSILQLYTNIDTLSINDAVLVGSDLEINASKIADSTSVLAMATVSSDEQIFSPKFQTKNVVGEAIWNRNHIDFSLDGDQKDQSNYLRLRGMVDFHRDSTSIKILPSTLKVLETIWEFNPDNVITVAKKDVTIRDLTMFNNNQFVSANGSISHDPEKKLSVRVNDLDLSILNPIVGRDISGHLTALFDLTNYFDNPYIENDLQIDSLSIDKFLIGDITGKNRWDTTENKFQINFFIDRQASRIVNVSGYYDPRQPNSPLNVKAKLANANLRILQPFLEDVFRSLDGTATGDFRIAGTLQKPLIEGEGRIDDGEAKINYLETTYKFRGITGLTPTSIYFQDMVLNDMYGHTGRLSGTITHDNFYSMRININSSFENFQVLNTTAKDNDLFYGQGYATGDVNIFGPVDNLKISANARTDKNTRIYVPIGGASEIERKEFIKFVSFADSTFQKSLEQNIKERVNLTGIALDFNLDVTPDAYCEIILDLKAGDIIRGRGNGELQFQFDTKGEFNMFGPFEFTEGWYNFTLYDIVNKDFEIKKGSRITWYGDAYEGVLDISAFYNQMASFAPIVSDPEVANNPPTQLKRKYPAQVLLKLDGPMLSPAINFDIIALDLPQNIAGDNNSTIRLAFEFQAFKNRIDEQELKRQVFSLIVLRKFSHPESFNYNGSFANSVSELLSNQLSNWVSQVDENLEINVDLSTFDDEAFNTFQLRLSYTFLNGRLRVTRDATTFYGSQNNTTTTTTPQQNSLATLAGDWTVDYLLTSDGKLRIKMYNRSNVNQILSPTSSQTSVTTGVSILHTQTFNQLKDIWKSARSRRKDEPETDIDANEEALQNKQQGSE